jgi:urease accessory protein
MGRFNALGMVLLLGDPMREAGTRLTELMTATPPARGMTLLATASPLRDGVVLRVAGVRLEDVAFWIRRSLAFLTPLLGGDPWIRKGEEVPR